MKITYKNHRFIDRYTEIETILTTYAKSFFKSGGLIYFHKNQFEVIAIDKNDIISIEN